MSEVAAPTWAPRACQPNRKGTGPKYGISFVALDPGKSLSGQVLSHRIHWYEMHWILGRHVPCIKAAFPCPICAQGKPTRPLGYIAFLVDGDRVPTILHVTTRQFQQEQLLKGSELRGLRLLLTHPSPSRRGPTLLQAEGMNLHPENLPAEPDIEDILQRINRSVVTELTKPVVQPVT